MLTNLDEDDGRPDSQKTVKIDQRLVLVLLIGAVQVELFNALHSQFLMLKGQFVGLGRKLRRVLVDVDREGGGEQNDLDGLGEKTEKKLEERH